MLGRRLQLTVLSSPVQDRMRKLALSTIRRTSATWYCRSLTAVGHRCGRVEVMEVPHSKRRALCSTSSINKSSSDTRTVAAGAEATIDEAKQSSGENEDTEGTRRWRRRSNLGLGTIAAALAVAAVFILAADGMMPNTFSEWDDQLVWQEMHELAQLSNMTNRDPRLIARWFDCKGFTGSLVVRDLPEVSSRYFVHVGHLPGREHHRVHHVAIRGTVSLTDLSIDLKTRQVFDEECGCNFHEGFKAVADAVVEDIMPFLERETEVKLAGHSLGGAVAVIVAAKLKLRGYKVGKVVTFGMPMVTDAGGAAVLRDLLHLMRVTHERDPVPLAPLTTRPSSADIVPKDDEFEEEQEEVVVENMEAMMSAGSGGDIVGGEKEAEVDEDEEGGDEGGDGKGARKGRRWRVPAYAHFGSQVVLLRRSKCLECSREEAIAASSPDPAARALRLLRRQKTTVGTWDDIWGPAPGATTIAASTVNFDGTISETSKPCEHCPSRGTTYYDPKGESGSFFDSPWLRLSNVNFTHRMNQYEGEVASRLRYHLMRYRTGGEAKPPLPEAERRRRRTGGEAAQSPAEVKRYFTGGKARSARRSSQGEDTRPPPVEVRRYRTSPSKVRRHRTGDSSLPSPTQAEHGRLASGDRSSPGVDDAGADPSTPKPSATNPETPR